MKRVICIGRAGVDFYAAEEGVPFELVRTLRKSFGGSPLNIAVGLKRLGVPAGFIGKVSDDMIGHSVLHFLKAEGVNTDGIRIDKAGNLNGIAVTETRPENCRVVIYRTGAADLSLCPADIDPEYIRPAGMLVVSGTALSVEPSRSAVMKSIDIARAFGISVFTDLDYRPYSWVNPQETARVYWEVIQKSDYLTGNTEEFNCLSALPGNPTAESIIGSCMRAGVKMLILKKGAEGSQAYTRTGVITQGAYLVKTRKPFGAGDAFAASLIEGIMNGRDTKQSLSNGAATAAMVVADFGCAECDQTLPWVYFNRIFLKKGETYRSRLRKYESVAVVATGTVSVSAGKQAYENLGKRAGIWEGNAESVYIPSDMEAIITGIAEKSEVFIAGGITDKQYQPFAIRAEDVEQIQYGSDETKTHRKIKHILGKNANGRAGNLLVSELFTVGAGGWSGFPPHKHDTERPPIENRFEEAYHFRFNPDHGFGAQFCTQEGEESGAVHHVRNGSTYLIDYGYHPSVAAPGYEMYYFTIIVGQNGRSLVQYFHPDHAYQVETIPGIKDMIAGFK
ncbi:hypothetical protein CHS0354_035195 [Potamilus streckersoni]|uniref:Carbohydrate kinase PfkB domain-containing protein n=1 Tax=Potamilus streckersoni TaxID=2493646 RepID=A0AAE0S2W0_9BIVA|nr:hypothetical protein CHS0354_035195 [Potamilus streckersoni]